MCTRLREETHFNYHDNSTAHLHSSETLVSSVTETYCFLRSAQFVGSRFANPATSVDKEQQAMDVGKSSEDKGKDSVIVFDGKEPHRAAKWFELSQATERFAEYHCGTPGVEIWLGVSPELTDENVTDAAQDALAFIRVYHGIREGDSSAKDDDFWQHLTGRQVWLS